MFRSSVIAIWGLSALAGCLGDASEEASGALVDFSGKTLLLNAGPARPFPEHGVNASWDGTMGGGLPTARLDERGYGTLEASSELWVLPAQSAGTLRFVVGSPGSALILLHKLPTASRWASASCGDRASLTANGVGIFNGSVDVDFDASVVRGNRQHHRMANCGIERGEELALFALPSELGSVDYNISAFCSNGASCVGTSLTDSNPLIRNNPFDDSTPTLALEEYYRALGAGEVHVVLALWDGLSQARKEQIARIALSGRGWTWSVPSANYTQNATSTTVSVKIAAEREDAMTSEVEELRWEGEISMVNRPSGGSDHWRLVSMRLTQTR